jgi:ATP-dependent DNA ligase
MLIVARPMHRAAGLSLLRAKHCRRPDSRSALLIGYHTGMLRPVGFIEPCLPTHARSVPGGPQWVYEIKHDGFRFVCWRVGERVRVFSRQGIDWTDRVPLIAEALAALRVKSVVLDGEGVICRPDGISDFDLLRAGIGRSCREAFLYAFDLLELDGADLRRESWETRRTRLASLLREARSARNSSGSGTPRPIALAV